MERKIRVYEYTTKDYGKGYFVSKNQKSAEKKAFKQVGVNNLAFYKDRPMISYYSKEHKKNAIEKYGKDLWN